MLSGNQWLSPRRSALCMYFYLALCASTVSCSGPKIKHDSIAGSRQVSGMRREADERIIASLIVRRNEMQVPVSLVVDVDQNIIQQVGADRERLGQASSREMVPLLAEKLSGQEVCFDMRSETEPDGSRTVWIVSTWALDQDSTLLRAFYVYIILQEADKIRVLEKMKGDMWFNYLIVEDINGDGAIEVAVSGRGESGISGWLEIRRIDEKDNVERIGFDGLQGYAPIIREDSGYQIVTSEDVVNGEARETRRYYYEWNATNRKYVVRRRTIERCYAVKG